MPGPTDDEEITSRTRPTVPPRGSSAAPHAGSGPRSAVAQTTQRFGGIDVVVNNAGYGYLGAVEGITDADVRRMFAVRINGTWSVVRAVLPRFRAARSSHVVNVSSTLGPWPLPDEVATASDHGVRVTIVEPAYFDTDFLRSDPLALPAATSDAYAADRRRPGTPPEAVIATPTPG